MTKNEIHRDLRPAQLLQIVAGCLALIFSPVLSAAEPAQTYQVKEGATPWHDREGWALTQIPPALVSEKAVPRQSCGSRSLVLPAGTPSALIGVSEGDKAAFMRDYPTAVDTGTGITLKNGGTQLAYRVLQLSSPPATLKGLQKSYASGLVLLALDADATAVKSAAPAAAAPAAAATAPAPAATTALTTQAPVATTALPVAAEPFTPPSDPAQFEIYLLMGQSNMLGRDTSKLAEQVNNSRIGSLDGEGRWTIAREPLWGGTGTGPGCSLAANLLRVRAPGVKIGLVSCAVGGSPLARWVKGGDLYARALARAKEARKTGTLRAIIWHQGETDSEHDETAATYSARWQGMVADLRKDLGLPDMPVVVGQLGPYLKPERFRGVEVVRTALRNLPAAVPHVTFMDSDGLTHKGDGVHFDAASEIELGRRYALALVAQEAAAKTPQPKAPIQP
jgi:hypothetical protein